jgi:hypothetical protein
MPATDVAMEPSPNDGSDTPKAVPVARHLPTRGRVGRRQVGLQGRGGSEAEELAALLLRRLAWPTSARSDVATDTVAIRRAFVRHRFTRPVRTYEKGDRYYSQLDTTLNLASIAAGIGASLLAASGSANGWTIALGVAIAGCQTVSQWLKPSRRAARRSRAASELRSEAWDLLQGRDRYRGKDTDQAWDIFCNQVGKVQDREQTLEDTEAADEPTYAAADDRRASVP